MTLANGSNGGYILIHNSLLNIECLINHSNVTFIGTTDNPTDSLEFHEAIREDADFTVEVAPSFRPDEAFAIGEEKFTNFVHKLQDVSSKEVTTYKELITEIEARVDYFNERGAIISDHGLGKLLYAESTDEEIEERLHEEAPADWWYDLEWTKKEK